MGEIEILTILCRRTRQGSESRHATPSHLPTMALASNYLYISLTGVILSILLLSPSTVTATALTYKIEANEKACFYAWIDNVGEKIAFYFAVPLSHSKTFLK